MDRIDFINSRDDIIQNIKTLYSYLNGEFDEDSKNWAIEKMAHGKNYVVEVIDDNIFFGPSRFVGYVNNTIDKHQENHGDGTQTDERIRDFYQKVQDPRLDSLFQKEMSKYNISLGEKKYWIPNDTTVDEIIEKSTGNRRRYWIARLSDGKHWNVAIENNLWCMQQRYDSGQPKHIVTQLFNIAKDVKVNDILLLTYSDDKIIYGYGVVTKCPLTATHTSNVSKVVEGKAHEFNDGIVIFEDAEAFYEDLRNGVDDWGQRIAVDRWHYYRGDSMIKNNGCGFARISGNQRQSLFEVDEQFATDIIEKLKNQYEKKYMLVSKTAQLLHNKLNIILQGAPGTGKTYNTAAIALQVLGVSDVDLSDHKAVMQRYEKLQDDQIFFTTFHQSLDYEDFVEGLKPRVQTDKDGNSIGVFYEPEDGIFKKACAAVLNDESKDIVECIDDYLQTIKGYGNKKEIPTLTGRSSLYVWWNEGNATISTRSTNSASSMGDGHSTSPLNIEKVKLQALGKGCENNWQQYAQAFIEAVKAQYMPQTNKPVVLIIDEINRGNVSKVFGELITLLEADKRLGGEHPIRVTLPYSKTLFGVPKNLYIIGTMNTTDRSTGSLDYALRRRFAFVILKSDRLVIEKHYDDLRNANLKKKAIDLFDDIRSFIEEPKHIGGDLGIDDLMVGHSYFMAKSEEELTSKMEFEILPLIAEYINDGILCVSREEKREAFDSWASLRPIQVADTNEHGNL